MNWIHRSESDLLDSMKKLLKYSAHMLKGKANLTSTFKQEVGIMLVVSFSPVPVIYVKVYYANERN